MTNCSDNPVGMEYIQQENPLREMSIEKTNQFKSEPSKGIEEHRTEVKSRIERSYEIDIPDSSISKDKVKHEEESNPSTCQTDSDCISSMYTCMPTLKNNKVEFVCKENQCHQNEQLFALCNKGENCCSQICLTSGYCSKLCFTDNDCKRIHKDYSCGLIKFETHGQVAEKKVCYKTHKSCTTDYDCHQSHRCIPNINEIGKLGLRCLPRNAPSNLNSDCISFDECESAICYKKKCTVLCRNDGDCGKSSCINEKISLLGISQIINVKICDTR